MTYSFDEKKVVVRAGEYLLLPPFLPHKIEDCSSDFLKTTLAFSAVEGGAFCVAMKKKGGVARAFTADMEASFSFIKEELKEPSEYSSKMISESLRYALYTLAKSELPTVSTKRNMKNDARLFKAMRFIEENTSLFLSCEEIASYCFLSVKQLNRIFINGTGVPLLEYIHREKVLQMQRLLSKSDMSLSEIASALGFSSQYYCSRFFHSHVGVSPNEYRKMQEWNAKV